MSTESGAAIPAGMGVEPQPTTQIQAAPPPGVEPAAHPAEGTKSRVIRHAGRGNSLGSGN
jgi:hypothetical protein